MSFARHLKAATPGRLNVALSGVENPEGFTVTEKNDTNIKGGVAGWKFSIVTASEPYFNLRLISGDKNFYCDVHPDNVVKVLSNITAGITEERFWTLCDD